MSDHQKTFVAFAVILLVGLLSLAVHRYHLTVSHLQALEAAALEDTKSKQEAARQIASRSITEIVHSNRDRSYDQWPESDRDRYQLLRMVLKEYDEEWPENP